MAPKMVRGVVAVALGAGAAWGQGTMTFCWTTGDTGNHDGVIGPGEALVATLMAGMDPSPPVGFAGSKFDIAGGAVYQAGTLVWYENLIDSGWDWPGDDNSIRGIECIQLPPLFNPDFVADNPIALYRIGWRPDGYTPGWVGFWGEHHQSASVYTDDFGTAIEYEAVIEPGGMRIVPGPGAVLLLVGAGLGVLGRRRVRAPG